MAKLVFKYGVMGSGKTLDLLRTAYNYEERGHNVIIAKPTTDTKGKKNLVSRLKGIKRKTDFLIDVNNPMPDILEIRKACFDFKWPEQAPEIVLVDEAHLLPPYAIDALQGIVEDTNTDVICYGLRTDFQVKGFPGSDRLLQIADELIKLPAICDCGREATINARFINGVFTSRGEQVAIDGKGKTTYKSLCTECYDKLLGEE